MINRLLIVTLAFMTLAFSAGNTFAAPVSATGGGTTIASLTAMLEHQRAGLTKEQMMMVTKDQMTLLTQKMIIEKLIKVVMTKDQVTAMMAGIAADRTVLSLSEEQAQMLISGQTMENKSQMLAMLNKLMITLTKDQMMMMVDQMMMTMNKDQMMLMLDNMMKIEAR